MFKFGELYQVESALSSAELMVAFLKMEREKNGIGNTTVVERADLNIKEARQKMKEIMERLNQKDLIEFEN